MKTVSYTHLNHRWRKKMGYRDCPCLKCDHGGEREKRIECRRKCTEFVAWKLSMQAVRQKKKEDKNKFYSETKLKCYRRKAMKQKTGPVSYTHLLQQRTE